MASAVLSMLASEPERYIPDIRTELETNSVNGKIDKQSLGKLVKLDSFIRETGRLHPIGISKLLSISM